MVTMKRASKTKSIEEQVRETIGYYYAFGVNASTAAYRVTPAYRRLMRRRAQAEKDYHYWFSLLVDLRKRLPDLDVRDTTHLDVTNCYQCEILLRPGAKFSPEDRNTVRSLGRMDTLHVYVSILGPYAYVTCERARFDPERGDLYYEYLKERSDVLYQALEEVTRWLDDHHYLLLSPEIVLTPLMGISLEYTEDERVLVFDCLFDEFINKELLYPDLRLPQ
jgi:hypothetical protein